MAWINVHQELKGHPKVKRLAEKLGVHRAHALGLLVDLWLWAISYAPHGDISSFPAQDIAEAADWNGDPQKFVDAAIETGWLDPDGKIHDWGEHRLYFDALQEKQSRTREKTRKRVADWRERQKSALDEKKNGNALRNESVTRHVTLKKKRGNAPIEENRIGEDKVLPPYPPRGGRAGGEPPAGKVKGITGPMAAAVAEVSDGFAVILDQNIGDPNWKAVYGRTIAKHSRKLVTLFGGDAGKALDCIEGIAKHAKARGWVDWTPRTVVDRAGDWAAGRLGAR